jgi:hypothetical protein
MATPPSLQVVGRGDVRFSRRRIDAGASGPQHCLLQLFECMHLDLPHALSTDRPGSPVHPAISVVSECDAHARSTAPSREQMRRASSPSPQPRRTALPRSARRRPEINPAIEPGHRYPTVCSASCRWRPAGGACRGCATRCYLRCSFCLRIASISASMLWRERYEVNSLLWVSRILTPSESRSTILGPPLAVLTTQAI